MPKITPIQIRAVEPRTIVRVSIEVDQATYAAAVDPTPKPWQVRIEGTYISEQGAKPLPTTTIPVRDFNLESEQPADGTSVGLWAKITDVDPPVADNDGQFDASVTLLNPADHEQDGPKQFP